MSFDLDAVQHAVACHGRVARVVVADVKGSAPREVGAAMLVWDGGQSGTIGGGALEFEAAAQAFTRKGLTHHALGPMLGQCCGGSVGLWTEQFDAQGLCALQGQSVIARGDGCRPLAVQRLCDGARARGEKFAPCLVQGWMVEPVLQPRHDLWIWGAGHVGRALVDVLAPLPDWQITWLDTAKSRFPEQTPPKVAPLWGARPEGLLARAPVSASHLIVTYSHELDLALCHAALAHGFGWAGLIGSATKWARFRKRLCALGHAETDIDQICCPIGQKDLGKTPQAIAIGVAAQLLISAKRDASNWAPHFSASRA